MTDGLAMAGDVADAYVLGVDDERSTTSDPPGANPPRDGDAKPGISTPYGVATRPPGCRVGGEANPRRHAVKVNLARFMAAVVILACLALTLSAGIRWD